MLIYHPAIDMHSAEVQHLSVIIDICELEPMSSVRPRRLDWCFESSQPQGIISGLELKEVS